MKRYALAALLMIWLYTISNPVFACGPMLYPDESRFALFKNGLNGQEGFEPFYYSEAFLNSTSTNPQQSDYLLNCKEWQKVCGKKVALEDIYQLQYHCAADSFALITAADYKDKGQNSFLNWLREHKPYLEYMQVSKAIEATQTQDDKRWQVITEAEQMADMDSLARLCRTKALASKNAFLQYRYSFQALKMAYYAGVSETDKETYFQLYHRFLKSRNSILRSWSYLFYGLMQPQQEEQIKYVLLAFDACDEKKLFCYTYINGENLDAVISSGHDKHLLEIALAIKSMRNPGKDLESIQKIYALNPNSKYIPILVAREINKIEDWIWSYSFLSFVPEFKNKEKQPSYSEPDYKQRMNAYILSNRKKDIEYLNSLIELLKGQKKAGKDNRNFNNLAICHLYNVCGRYDEAAQYLKQTRHSAYAKYNVQRTIEEMIIYANTQDLTSAQSKSWIVARFAQLSAWEAGRKAAEPDYAYEHSDNAEEWDDIGELCLMLSYKYKQAGDIITAGLLSDRSGVATNNNYTSNYQVTHMPDGWDYGPSWYADSMNQMQYNYIAYWDRYASVDDIYQLMKFKYKKDKTSFEQFISPYGWPPDDAYRDVILTKYVRDGQYKKALAVAQEMPDRFWEDNYEYNNYLPRTHIYDQGRDMIWSQDEGKVYPICSKKYVLQELVALEDSIAMPGLDGDSYGRLYNMLGKAKLNMTFNGAFWMMMSYGWSNAELDEKEDEFWEYYSFYPNSERYGANYYRGEDAIQCFQKAMQYARDTELRAAITLSMYTAYNLQEPRENKSLEQQRAQSIKTLGKQLREQYSKTELYQLAIISCPDIQS